MSDDPEFRGVVYTATIAVDEEGDLVLLRIESTAGQQSPAIVALTLLDAARWVLANAGDDETQH